MVGSGRVIRDNLNWFIANFLHQATSIEKILPEPECENPGGCHMTEKERYEWSKLCQMITKVRSEINTG